MIDQNLVRWINTSVAQAFTNAAAAATPVATVYIEGQEDTIPTTATSWAELHVSIGPEIEEVTDGNYEIDLTLTIMCTAVFTDDDSILDRLVGTFVEFLSICIPVYKYGNQSEDTAMFIESLLPKSKTKIQPWGTVQIDARTGPLRAKQTSVEQHFHMSF